MSPIEGVSDIRRLPRLGKIKLGIKKEGQRGPYPSATDYFVCPQEVQAVFGEKPTELRVMFPADDVGLIAPQWYKCYSYSQGLICKGDGKTCWRKVDADTGDFADKNTKRWEISTGICNPDECPMLASKQCRKCMSLFFILPDVPGLGVYQLDTSSFYSIVNMNSQLALDGFLRPFTKGRIAFIPLILSLGPQVVNPPGEGRKTVNVLSICSREKLADIIRISRQAPVRVLLPTVEEEEPPEDLYPGEVIGGPEIETEAATAPPVGSEEEFFAEVREEAAAVAEELKTQKAAESATAAEPLPAEVGEGAAIDLTWLKEALKTVKWTEHTAKTWIAANLHVDTQGKLTEVLSRLTREQAEKFVKELNDRATRVQPGLFD